MAPPNTRSRMAAAAARRAAVVAAGDWSWHNEAACRHHAANWFPADDRDEEAAKAKRVCKEECPVLASCREFAHATHQEHGIWAGMGASERRRDRRVWLRSL